jgi:hypothetical protein
MCNALSSDDDQLSRPLPAPVVPGRAPNRGARSSPVDGTTVLRRIFFAWTWLTRDAAMVIPGIIPQRIH